MPSPTLVRLSNLWIFGLWASLLTNPANGSGDSNIQFNKDIRPILAEACFSCHGPDSAARQAELRLDKREVAIERGAIVPGNADSSELICRIRSKEPSVLMPPPETKKALTAAQIDLLERWIRAGAEYQPQWSLIPPTRPAIPEVKLKGWGRNPIDQIVDAGLAQAGLNAAAEADRRTLVRRLALDLTGLPPSSEVVNEFVQDTRSDAYERLVDKLMASPRWGEHRARYWLDVARYADTHGIHIDNYRAMWPYRDWVINAFNRNMPFDEFTIENLAGDLLPNATVEQQVGSGFNRCNITTSEGGAIDEEYLVLYARDRVETTCVAWMGLTAGCAVCHDHKFDALTQREFYQLAAFFNNSTQKAMDGNVKDTAPVVSLLFESDRARREQLEKQVSNLATKIADERKRLRPEFDVWLASASTVDIEEHGPSVGDEFAAPLNDDAQTIHYTVRGQSREAPTPSSTFWPEGRTGRKGALSNVGAVLSDADAANFEADQPFSVASWFKLKNNDPRGALVARIDEDHDLRGWDVWIEDRRIGFHLVNRWPTKAIYVRTASEYTPEQWMHVAAVYDGSGEAAGLRIYVNGQPQPLEVVADTLTGTTKSNVPFKIGARTHSAPLNGLWIEDVNIFGRSLREQDVQSLLFAGVPRVLSTAAEERTTAEVEMVFDWWLTNKQPNYAGSQQELQSLARERNEIKVREVTTLVMHEKADAPTAFVLKRGEYNQRLEQVGPETPAMFPPFPPNLPRNRLGFARWLVRPEHPLTARVAVNRFWSEVFGVGLVKTAGDFGVQGQLPSNPELLDWLAVEFRESGWDVKHLFRLMVTSATYRQSATASPDAIERDPENRLLSHGPRFRMDAEMIRDYALCVSSLLSPKIGGRSAKPYQPPGVWEAVAMLQSNTGTYEQGAGEDVYRRSVYTLWKRAAPPASMEIFNAPAREVCTVARERTNTPLQALVTMNDVQFVEAARRLAERAIQSKTTDTERIQFAAERILARPLDEAELAIANESLHRFEKFYRGAAEDSANLIEIGDSPADGSLAKPQLAAWTMLVSQLMNLDEVLNK